MAGIGTGGTRRWPLAFIDVGGRQVGPLTTLESRESEPRTGNSVAPTQSGGMRTTQRGSYGIILFLLFELRRQCTLYGQDYEMYYSVFPHNCSYRGLLAVIPPEG